MDTTFWGPSGHSLFHLLTYRFDQNDLPGGRKDLRSLFRSVGHVLPCIYCRRSFQQYARQFPLRRFLRHPHPHSFLWYYHIHNLINAKLRGQGYPMRKDPSLQTVTRTYQRLSSAKNKGPTCLVGRDFLYAVTYQFSTSLSERRQRAYRTFFRQLAVLYPIDSIREEYVRYLADHPVEDAMKGPLPLTRWFHRFDRRVNAKVCSFQRRCNILERFHVKTCANRTCRRK